MIALNHVWLADLDISLCCKQACDTKNNNMRVTVQSRRTPDDACYLSQHACVTGLDAICVLSLAITVGYVGMPFTPCANGDNT